MLISLAISVASALSFVPDAQKTVFGETPATVSVSWPVSADVAVYEPDIPSDGYPVAKDLFAELGEGYSKPKALVGFVHFSNLSDKDVLFADGWVRKVLADLAKEQASFAGGSSPRKYRVDFAMGSFLTNAWPDGRISGESEARRTLYSDSSMSSRPSAAFTFYLTYPNPFSASGSMVPEVLSEKYGTDAFKTYLGKLSLNGTDVADAYSSREMDSRDSSVWTASLDNGPGYVSAFWIFWTDSGKSEFVADFNGASAVPNETYSRIFNGESWILPAGSFSDSPACSSSKEWAPLSCGRMYGRHSFRFVLPKADSFTVGSADVSSMTSGGAYGVLKVRDFEKGSYARFVPYGTLSESFATARNQSERLALLSGEIFWIAAARAESFGTPVKAFGTDSPGMVFVSVRTPSWDYRLLRFSVENDSFTMEAYPVSESSASEECVVDAGSSEASGIPTCAMVSGSSFTTGSGNAVDFSAPEYSEKHSFLKRKVSFTKKRYPTDGFATARIYEGVPVESLPVVAFGNVSEGSDVFSDASGNYVVNVSSEFATYPVIETGRCLKNGYSSDNVSEFSVSRGSWDSVPPQTSFVDYGGSHRAKFLPDGSAFAECDATLRANAPGRFSIVWTLSPSFGGTSHTGSSVTVRGIRDASAWNVRMDVVDPETGDSVASFDVPLVAKSSGASAAVIGDFFGFVKDDGTDERLYSEHYSNEQASYLRLDVLPARADGKPWSQFFSKISVKVENDNPNAYDVEPVLANSAAGGDLTIDKKIENGKQVVRYELRNLRWNQNGNQSLFYVKRTGNAMSMDSLGPVSANFVGTVEYEYYEADGGLTDFAVERLRRDDGRFETRLNYQGAVRNGYNRHFARLTTNLMDGKDGLADFRIVHPKGEAFPVMETYKLDGQVVKLPDAVQDVYGNDTVGPYGFVNAILTYGKPTIASSKYDSLRVRSMMEGDSDKEGAGYGNGSTSAVYSPAAYPDFRYQYSGTAGFWAAHFYDGRGAWTTSENCSSGNFVCMRTYVHNRPNVGMTDSAYGRSFYFPEMQVDQDQSIGKPVPKISELLVHAEVDSAFRNWLSGEGGSRREDMSRAPSMWYPLDYGSVRSLPGEWADLIMENYRKFPFLMAGTGDGTNVAAAPNGREIVEEFRAMGVTAPDDLVGHAKEIRVAGNSPYVTYDIDENVAKKDYEDGFHIHLAPELRWKVAYVAVSYETDKSPDNESVYGPWRSDRQGWLKEKIYLTSRIVLNGEYADLYGFVRNDRANLLKIVVPSTVAGVVSFGPTVENATGQVFSADLMKPVEDVFHVRNFVGDSGNLRYKVYFNAKQTVSTFRKTVGKTHVMQMTRSCGRRSCSAPRYDSWQTKSESAPISTSFATGQGYYYDDSFRLADNTTRVLTSWRYVDRGEVKYASGYVNVVENSKVNAPFEFVWNSDSVGLRSLAKRYRERGGNSFLSESSGNYQLRFQTSFAEFVNRGARITPAGKDDAFGLGTSYGDFAKVKESAFKGNPDSNSPAVWDWFLKNPNLTVKYSQNDILDELIDSFRTYSDVVEHADGSVSRTDAGDFGNVKVFYFGRKNLTFTTDVTMTLNQWSGSVDELAYSDPVDGSKKTVRGNGKAFRVFATAGDVYVNGNLVVKGTAARLGGIVILAGRGGSWIGRSAWWDGTAGEVFFGSRPNVFMGYVLANGLSVDYNYQPFIIMGGSATYYDKICSRVGMQIPEILTEAVALGWSAGMDLDQKISADERDFQLNVWLKVGCVSVADPKYQGLFMKRTFLERRE